MENGKVTRARERAFDCACWRVFNCGLGLECVEGPRTHVGNVAQRGRPRNNGRLVGTLVADRSVSGVSLCERSRGQLIEAKARMKCVLASHQLHSRGSRTAMFFSSAY